MGRCQLHGREEDYRNSYGPIERGWRVRYPRLDHRQLENNCLDVKDHFILDLLRYLF